ncbi:MAG: hypothetical protein MI746_13375 [Pseudomonadales bacterium]|nr:hypothetical protein [Pseudomonadales bacterium]
MDKFLAILQLLIAVLLAIMAVVTIHNLVNIATRPETISVVNTIIGQGVVIIALSVFATVLFRKAWKQLRQPGQAPQEPESPSE